MTSVAGALIMGPPPFRRMASLRSSGTAAPLDDAGAKAAGAWSAEAEAARRTKSVAVRIARYVQPQTGNETVLLKSQFSCPLPGRTARTWIRTRHGSQYLLVWDGHCHVKIPESMASDGAATEAVLRARLAELNSKVADIAGPAYKAARQRVDTRSHHETHHCQILSVANWVQQLPHRLGLAYEVTGGCP